LDSCKFDALKYSRRKKSGAITDGVTLSHPVSNTHSIDSNRRKFLFTGLTALIAAPSAFAKDLTGEKPPTRQMPISPPGALATRHLLKHCTSCHLCISKCPSKVLKPAFMEYGIGGIMQPLMSFERGFCNFNCTTCSTVCPNHALKPLTKEAKRKTQVGYVVFIEDICIVHTKGRNCGACAEHCPTQAVKMIPYKGGLTIPKINTEICVGCGGCEFICPVTPYKAIYVEGNAVHKEAQPFITETKEDIDIDDFGF